MPIDRRALQVAVVTETWPPEVNGVAMSLARVVEGLRARGHTVSLVRPRQTTDRAVEPGDMLTSSWPVPRYPQLRMGRPCMRRLLNAWLRDRPDVVHIATEGPLGWSALRAARRLGLPLSSDFRTNFHTYSRHFGAGWIAASLLAYLRGFHNRCDATMVPTQALAATLAADRFERLHVVGRGVDLTLFDPARRSEALRQSWGAAPDDLVLAYVGRLSPEKNLELVAASFEAIVRRSPRTRLLLVGDGPLRPALEQRCARALFAGHRHGEDLAAHYASADLFLFPSLTETYGNVVPEAMASALPVLAFDTAAAGQWIESGRNGMLAAEPTGASFVATAVHLSADATARRSIGMQARRSSERMGWQPVVARFEQVLVEAVRRPGVGASAPEPVGPRVRTA
jgi:glycosyltransferase involved in cell wall biosynthesis